MSMIMVIGLGSVFLIFLSVLATRTISDFRQVRNDRVFEQTINVGEAGIDDTLFKLTKNKTHNTGELLPTSFASVQAERDWVLAQASDNALITVKEGQWAVVKSFTSAGTITNIVYSVGYIPTRSAPTKIRVVRVEYDFSPFLPGSAILTGGDLQISGNPQISGKNGSAHANGNVTVNGNPVIAQFLSAHGTWTVADPDPFNAPNTHVCANAENPAACREASGGGEPERDIPTIEPRENYAMSEYDLCPSGDVLAGPNYPDVNGAAAPNRNQGSTPCTGDFVGDANGREYRGWKMTGNDVLQGAKWDFGGNTNYDGVYYIYLGSASISGNPGNPSDNDFPWEVTLFTEAQGTGSEPAHCPHTGGDIKVSGNPTMRSHTKGERLLLVAGRDLEVGGNPGAGQINYNGVLAAHEQFKLNGNPRIFGTIIANDSCDTPGSSVDRQAIEVSGNATITYDDAFEVPFGKTIRITRWQEI